MSNGNPHSARLYGVMQMLLTEYAQKRVAQPAAARGVVEEQDALDAVLNLAAVLDRNRQEGTLSRNDAEHMAAMLMLVREYLRPLPEQPSDGQGTGGDPVTVDLRTFVDGLRTVRARTGMRG